MLTMCNKRSFFGLGTLGANGLGCSEHMVTSRLRCFLALAFELRHSAGYAFMVWGYGLGFGGFSRCQVLTFGPERFEVRSPGFDDQGRCKAHILPAH